MPILISGKIIEIEDGFATIRNGGISFDDNYECFHEHLIISINYFDFGIEIEDLVRIYQDKDENVVCVYRSNRIDYYDIDNIDIWSENEDV